VPLLHKFAALRESHDIPIRIAAFYGASFLIVGTYAAFLPLWLRHVGLSETQIAVTVAMPVILRPVFTTTVAFLADRSGRHVTLLKLLVWGALGSMLILPFSDGGFPLIFMAFSLFALFWTTVIPLIDAVALTAARRGAADYGQVRLWGSFGYIAVILTGGVAVDFFGPPAALWLFIGSAVSVVAVSRWLPDIARINGVANGEIQSGRIIRLADVKQLLRLPLLWLFLAATSATQAAHAVYYVFGTIHWTTVGISPTVIGMLWSIGVVAEMVLFAYAWRITRHLEPVPLMVIGAAAACIRWTLTSLDPPLGLLFLLQVTHGLTFGATYLGSMEFMKRAFPSHMTATVQGVYASFSAGVGMGGSYLAAGPLYRTFGSGAYLGMAALSLMALALSILLLQRWHGGGVLSSPEHA
jgi:MFS transporter, PPP family, 3-phenylpropionic acid transporter